jgi:azobenzene reductase
MSRTLTIVGLGGSLARRSRSRAALEVALEGAASAGAETSLLDLRELELRDVTGYSPLRTSITILIL